MIKTTGYGIGSVMTAGSCTGCSCKNKCTTPDCCKKDDYNHKVGNTTDQLTPTKNYDN